MGVLKFSYYFKYTSLVFSGSLLVAKLLILEIANDYTIAKPTLLVLLDIRLMIMLSCSY